MKSLMEVMLLAVALTVLAGCGEMATQGAQSGTTAKKSEPQTEVMPAGY